MAKVRVTITIKSPLGSYNVKFKEFESVEAYDKYVLKYMQDHSKGKIVGEYNYEEYE